MHLHQALEEQVSHWRRQEYACTDFPAIAEILRYAHLDGDQSELRFLRQAQFVALETYWYLRLILQTPTIPKLYEQLFPKMGDRLAAMGVSAELFQEADYDYHALIERVLQDNEFVRQNRLESLRETLSLAYPSYILALALVKPEGFDQHLRRGEPVYTARVSFAENRAHLYQLPDQLPDEGKAREFSFHYAGYNFDSRPEAEYLERVLNLLGEQADQLLGVWFTGGLSDPGKTDLFAEYLGEDGRWHRYTPDFVLQRKDGKHLVVEIKSDRFSAEVNADLARHQRGEAPTSKEGRKAVALSQWQDLNPEVLHYQVIFASETLETEALERTREFLLAASNG